MSKFLTPFKGWRVVSGTLQPDRTVLGYHQRDQDVRGHCYLRDCRRSCHVDHARLIEQGLGALRIDQVKRTMACGRIDGCNMEWTEDKRRESFSIGALVGRPAVALRIRCGKCNAAQEIAPEAMIRRLSAEGKGDRSTGFGDVAQLLTAPCKACGWSGWAVEVAWPDPATIGGRRKIQEAEAKARAVAAGSGLPKDPLAF